MTNPFYVASGTPATSSFGASQPMRSEFQAIQGGFEKFPDFTGSAPGTFLINNFTATGITTAPTMLIDASGNIGIGTPPNPTTYLIDVRRDRASGTYLRLMNASTDPASGVGITLNNGSLRNFHINYLSQFAVNSGINRLDGAMLIATGDGGLTLATGVSTPAAGLYFATNSIERARFDNDGTFTVHTITMFDTTVFQKGIVDVAGPLTVGTATSGVIFLRSNGGAGGITGTIIASGAATYLESILGPLVFLVGGGTVGSPGSATQRMIINNASGDVTFNGGMLEFANSVGGSLVGRIGPNWSSNAYGGLTFYVLENSSFVEGMRIEHDGHLTVKGAVTSAGPVYVGSASRPGEIQFTRDSDGYLASRVFEIAGGAGLGIESSGGTAYIAFFASSTGLGSNAERMRIDAAGNVGIGMVPTTGAILDLGRDQAAGTYAKITNNNSAGYGSWNISNNVGSSGGVHFFGSGYATSGSTKADGTLLFSTGAGGLSLNTYDPSATIAFFTGSVERMRIDSGGTVRVLNLVPSAQAVSVISSDAANLAFVIGGSSSSGTAYGGLPNASQVVLEAQNSSSFYIGTITGSAPIVFATNRVERMRIASAGDVTVTTGILHCPGGYSSWANQTVAPHNTLVNAGMSFSVGTWIVQAYIYTAGTGNYSASAIVVCDNYDARAAFTSDGTLLHITVSGLGLYGSQGSGVTQTINWFASKMYG